MAGNAVRIGLSLDDRVSNGLDKIRGKLDTLGGRGTAASFFGNFTNDAIHKGIGLVQNALSGVVDQAFKSVEAASDLREAVALNDQVFGQNSDAMKAWAAGAVDAFGESQRSALTYAANFGNVLKASGLEMDDVAAKSQELTERAADLGSAFNMTGEEVATALRSGLVGEAEPLRRFGVLLSEAAVKAEAYGSGIAQTGVELTEAQKVQARYNIILRQTSESQGMFGRDTGSLADAQKSLSAAVEEVQGKIGEKLLPVMVDLANFAKNDLIPAIEGVVEAFDKMAKGGEDNSDPLVNLGNLFDDLGQRGEKSKTAIGAMEEAFMDLIHPMSVLLDDGLDMVTFWDTYVGKSDEVTDAQKRLASAMADASKDDEYVSRFQKMAKAGPEAMEEARKNAVAIASRTPGDIADALRDERTEWQKAVDLLGDDIHNGMSTAAEIAKIQAELAGKNIANGLKSKDPIIRAQALATQRILTDRLSDLANSGTGYGWQLGANYAAGLKSTSGRVYTAAALIAKQAELNLRLSSPAKEGPLSKGGGPEGWGERLGILYGKGMSATLPDVGGMLGSPSFGGGSVAAPASFASGGGGSPVQFVYAPTYSTASLAEAQAFVRAILPELTLEMRRQGKLPAVAAGTF